ncbi:MAG TPA: EAL domain-containing protein [Solirubrobacteraceae bacterium]|jgi:EAL domain-containing protein (putative c-di-GMP-specific phosphodiesterase class I)|nr:EAL domain-containing protein [Solirubrobacteraceae bacterium]
MSQEAGSAADGVRLLSHRPSVLYKVEHHATEPVDGDIAVEGLVLAGPGWDERLKELLASLAQPERACLFAMRLGDDQALPLPAETLLDRARTDWFPDFLSHGQMKPHFQPIVDLRTGRVYGREALMRGKLGATEVRGGELLAAAEAHDALFSFDYRARTAALEIGLPLLPEGEILFVNLDPRAVLDVESSLRTTWPVVGRLGADPSLICLEIVKPERCPDRDLLRKMVEAHRKRGALLALDDLSGGSESLACLEALRPDVGKIDQGLTAGIQHSDARRRLVMALVECAHELGCKVVAEGIERVDEYETMVELGVDLGQGYYFGHPAERPMAVDGRLFKRRGELV